MESRLELVISSRQAERELDRLNGRLNSVDQAGGRAQGATNRLSGEISGLRTVALAASGALAAMGVSALGRDVFNTVASVEKMRASLVTVTGSIGSANAAWDQLREFAKTTPFELEQSVQGFIRMKSMGLDPTESAMRSFANTSAAMNTDLLQMVEAVADATVGEFERLRSYGIRASQDGDRVALTFQGNTTEIGNNAREIQQYLENIGNTTFADAAIDQMDTLGGKANNLKDSITELYLVIGEAGATDLFNAALDGSAEAVDFLSNNIESLARGVDLLADAALIAGGIFGARFVSAIAAGTASLVTKTAATLADAKAEALAAQQVVRRTGAELQSANAILARSVAEAKATAGTNAHAFAMQSLTAASARATAAQSTHTAATNVSAAAMGRASVAARGLSGALALVGGPVGAAVIAGAGLYYFREELGLTDSKMQGTVDNVEELGSTFVDEFASLGTEIVGAFRGMRAEMIELDAGFLDLKAGALESFAGIVDGSADLINMGLIPIQHALNALDQGFADWINRFANAFESAGDMPFGMANLFGEQVSRMRSMADGLTEGMIEPIGISTTALESNAQAWREQAEAMRGSAENIRNGVNPAASAALDIFKPLSEWLFETNDALNEPVDSEAAKAAKTLADNFESLKRSLDPSYSSLMDFWEGIELLNEAIDTTTIEGMSEYNRLVGQLTERYAEAIKGSDDAKKAMERLTQQYDSAHSRARELSTDLAAINQAWRDDPANGDQYARMVQSVREEMAELAAETDETGREFERFGNVFDDTMVDMIMGATDGFDTIEQAGKRMIAELLWAAGKNEIRIRMGMNGSGPMKGGFNQLFGTGSGDGIGSLISGGRTLLGLGSTAATTGGAALSGGFMGAAATQSAGSLYGMAATGGVAQAGLMSSITSGISAAMPWLAGGALIDNVLGLGIVDGIVSGISGLFGGSPTPFGGRFGTRSTTQGFEHQGNESSEGQFYRESALGTVGFLDQGTERLQRAGTGDKAWADELAAGAAQIDNLVASLAQGEPELNAMRAAVQGLETSSRSAADIVDFALKDRPRAALEALGGDFGVFVRGLSGGIEEVVQQAQMGQQAHSLLSASMERLNLQFDATGSSAYEAASNIAQLAGGVEQLASLQDSYYQSFFSEAERANSLQQDLAQSLAQMGYALPATRDGFRALVEQQNQLTQSGQENYVQLLQLSGSFDQLQTMLESTGNAAGTFAARLSELNDQLSGLEDDVRRAYRAFEEQSLGMQVSLLEAMGDSQAALALKRERELQGIDPLLHETQRFIWAMEDEARAKQDATQAAQNYVSELSRLQSSLGGISQWIDQRNATSQTPGLNLEAAGEQFARQLVLAESGDRNALQSITQYADSYLAAGEEMFASGGAFQSIQQEVLAALEALPGQISSEEYLAAEIRESLFDALEGKATGAEINALMQRVASGDLSLESALESIYGTSEGTESNTQNLEERARDQLSSLDGLIGEMTRTTNQFVGLNSTMISLQDSINALGVAQEEIARIERERVSAEEAERERLERERQEAQRVSQINSNISGFESAAAKAQQQSEALSGRLDPRDAGNIERLIDRRMDDNVFSNAEWQEMITHLSGVFGRDSLEYIFGREYAAMYRNQTRANEERAKLDGSHASGLWNVPFDGYVAQLHKGEMVAPAETANMLRDMSSGGAAMPALPPLLGKNDLIEVVRDLKNEVSHLRRENREMQEQISGNTRQTRDAVVGVGEDAHQQREQHTRQLERLNRNAKVKVRT